MSNRTSEASRAVRLAWKNEQKLVREGQGTRDWTIEEQKAILEDGIAYDSNGNAYCGHHMQSVELFPQYQGEPGNIQFLTKEEHLKAHDNWFRNLTNWYYNPTSGEKEYFEDNKYRPCETITLTQSILSIGETAADIEADAMDQTDQNGTNPHNTPSGNTYEKATEIVTVPKGDGGPQPPLKGKPIKKRRAGGLWGIFRKAKQFIEDFPEDHPVTTAVFEGGGQLLKQFIGYQLETLQDDIESEYEKRQSSENAAEAPVPSESVADSDSSLPESIPDKPDRASPSPNEVSRHRQRYHTKNGVEWRDKEPYPRGGNKDKDDAEE